MDIPKIYIGGTKKQTVPELRRKSYEESGISNINENPPSVSDIFICEDESKETVNLHRNHEISIKNIIGIVMLCIFCAISIAMLASMLTQSYSKIETGIPSILKAEVFGKGYMSKSGNTPQNGVIISPQTDNDFENEGHDTVPSETVPPAESTEPQTETGDVQTTPQTQAPNDDSSENNNSDDQYTPPSNAEALPISRSDLSTHAENGFELQNETKYTPDLSALFNAPPITKNLAAIQAQYGAASPSVLIIHTHGTEAYSPDGAESCDPSAGFRSKNIEENVVAVGKTMAQTLTKCGIGVLHSTVMYDSEDYKGAYAASAAAVREYLKEYPSIQYIFDVHRDSITRSDGSAVAPITELYGKKAAQIMLVVGTDEGGSDHVGWENNLNFAAKLQAKVSTTYPSFARKLNLRRAAFNQGISPGYLLLEVGSHANSLPEAKRAAAAAAISIAEVIGADTSKINAADIISAAE